MSEKERRTVTLSKSNDEWLGETGRNASELVDHLVTEYRKSGGPKGAAIQLRIDQLESEIESLRSQVDTKESELERLQERKDRAKQQETLGEEQLWEETLSRMQFKSMRSTGTFIDSPDKLVERRALEHGMDTDDFREEAIRRWEDEHQ